MSTSAPRRSAGRERAPAALGATVAVPPAGLVVVVTRYGGVARLRGLVVRG
jgi:hypothetical protein